jgi:hypothetical protein
MKEILLFGKALKWKDVSPMTVNHLAVKKGYVVHPDCCNTRVMKFLESIPNNYNTTFYQSVADVVEKNRFDLLLDQITHYTSTYGTEYVGTPYIANDNFGVDSMLSVNFSDCKVIQPITEAEIAVKLEELLTSGIALKGDTLDNIFDLIDDFGIIDIDVDQIKNVEAKMIFYSRLNLLPHSPDEFVRYMVYQLTGETLLIKNQELINQIRANSMRDTEKVIKIHNDMIRFGLATLSSVFFRYKPFFLALRGEGHMMRKMTNKLRKLANKYHRPFVAGYWETILSKKELNVQEVLSKAKSVSNFKLVRLIKAIDERMAGASSKFFVIRNGKTFIKENNNTIVPSRQIWLRDILMSALIDNLKEKQIGRVKLPTDIRLAIPTSEKTYVGNIPFGSYIIPSKSNSIFGINWFGEDGAQDLDLSYIGLSGQKIGWNSRYYDSEYNQTIIYSGDMTFARPEACEYMFCKEGLEDGIISVNAFNAKENSKYRFFVGQTNDDFTVSRETPDQSMINFSAPMTITGESCIGFYVDGRIYFSDLNQGTSRVSRFTPRTRDMIKYFVDTKDAFVYWDELLTLAGCKIVTDDEECDIDLSDGDISTMISLLS